MESRIFLIGFMGSGKSTLGAQLARRLDYRFTDMDQLIEETAEMTIPEIFHEHGEEVFRKWEHDILLELCQLEKLVVSTGGGVPCHSENMALMNSCGSTIYLKISPEALVSRLIKSRTERPLITGKSEPELLNFIKTTLKNREEYYSRATHVVKGFNIKPEELIDILQHS